MAVEIACRDVLASLVRGSTEIAVSAEATPASGMIVSLQVSGVVAAAEQDSLRQQIDELLGSFSLTIKTEFV